MGRIQSSVGLVTGVPIADTVNQLIALSARPRDLLVARNNRLQQQQTAINELKGLAAAIGTAAETLGNDTPFDAKTVASSNDSLIAATVTGEPAAGVYQFTPVRRAQTHQLLSSGFTARDQPVGAGSLSLRFGGFVDNAIDLSELNGGAGVQRGRIRITDRSGASAVVDLRFAQTVDDVLHAINLQTDINVTAVIEGDRFKLIDNTGQSVSNLKVAQFGAGTTAADLGLSGIDVAAIEATGQDVLTLHAGLSIQALNDGSGVSLRSGAADLDITLHDGTNLLIDFSAGGANPKTLGDLLTTLNNAHASLSAQISADGDRIELIDSSTGGNAFVVASAAGGSAAEDLGLTGSEAGGVITSRRLQSGLKSALLTSLSGGSGLGALGMLSLTDRSGASANVDLSSAESLDDVIRLINASAPAGITARINAARNGIELVDTSGGAGNLIVANGDATNSADKLKIAIDAAVSKINSGSLDLQTINEQSAVEKLNYGQSIDFGSFTVTDSNGASGTVEMAALAPKTVGDVIDAINALGIGVTASINAAGDGLLLTDTAGGAGELIVADVGSGTAAADLQIAGQSSGTPKTINGSTTITVQISATDTLDNVIDKINDAGGGVTASLFNGGSGSAPFRLSLVSRISGKAGALVVDTSQSGFAFQEVAAAQDALLLVGSPDSVGAGVLATSPENIFDQVIEGVSLSVDGTSNAPVSISVAATDESLVSGVQAFVDGYNALRNRLDELTFFNAATGRSGVLFGSSEALRLESALADLLAGTFSGAGSIKSLVELGVKLDADGKLQFDTAKLQAKYAADPDAVKAFFTTATFGVAAKFNAKIESLAGDTNSLLTTRADGLQSNIDANTARIDQLNERLERQRERLLLEFFAMETAVARLQASLSSIQQLQSLSPVLFGSSNQ